MSLSRCRGSFGGFHKEKPQTVMKHLLTLLIFLSTSVVKKNLTDRIVFGIEFGATFNTLIGKMEYNDAPGKKQSLKVRQFNPILDRLINDIVLMIRI